MLKKNRFTLPPALALVTVLMIAPSVAQSDQHWKAPWMAARVGDRSVAVFLGPVDLNSVRRPTGKSSLTLSEWGTIAGNCYSISRDRFQALFSPTERDPPAHLQIAVAPDYLAEATFSGYAACWNPAADPALDDHAAAIYDLPMEPGPHAAAFRARDFYAAAPSLPAPNGDGVIGRVSDRTTNRLIEKILSGSLASWLRIWSTEEDPNFDRASLARELLAAPGQPNFTVTRIRLAGREQFYVVSSWGESGTMQIGTQFNIYALLSADGLQVEEWHADWPTRDILNIVYLGNGVDGLIIGSRFVAGEGVGFYDQRAGALLNFSGMRPTQLIAIGD